MKKFISVLLKQRLLMYRPSVNGITPATSSVTLERSQGHLYITGNLNLIVQSLVISYYYFLAMVVRISFL